MKKSSFLKKPTHSDTHASAAKKRGLGRGMDSLIPAGKPPAEVAVQAQPAPSAEPAASSDGKNILELVIADIARSPYQPRRDFREDELKELAESLKNNGLVQPPTVRRNSEGRFELIAGERRIRAAEIVGWKKIRVNLVEADDLTAAAMTATENLQREDLNPIEEAVSYKTLQDTFNLTQAEVAERVGKGRATVANSVRLLELPDEVKQLVETGLLSSGHAKVLLSIEGEKDRVVLARECVSAQLSVRALERRIARLSAPVAEKKPGTPDIPPGYAKTLCDNLRRHLGCAVRLTSAVTHANGKRTKGVLEIDFFDNDDLDRILKMVGVKVD
ncbi:MAG: ParB/RepB/Spo0J family partition protein [Kiritimatiellae bacterium]|nr:ParB/RepB/Spo0J family partition protein [Kiritimatiellia bacterium]